MVKLQFDTAKAGGAFKILNATNGGPWHKRHADDQWRTNLSDYKAARMHYCRNHDSAVCGIYGGPYSHDITCIFPDFDADAYDPASYDFACTDEAILVALDADTQTFFRLGQTIEHQIKKHGTLPPKDFHKWAVICEHIIRHYNEGWADGYHLNMEYWEIWNEADLDPDDSPNKRTWGGTKAQFFELYEIAATHLKSCFPHLKIGGPAIAGNMEWTEDFLRYMQERNVPIDFFSWHIYCIDPADMIKRSETVKNLLCKYGYESAESILNEWNYVKDFGREYVHTLEMIHGMKGAAFVCACMCEAQKSSIDMLMYYDTRPSVFNGLFDFYTYRPLKGYYPFLWYGAFYNGYREVRSDTQEEHIYSLCGVNERDKVMCMVAYYNDDDTLPEKQVQFDFGKKGGFEAFLLDETHDATPVFCDENLQFTLKVNSCILIKEK